MSDRFLPSIREQLNADNRRELQQVDSFGEWSHYDDDDEDNNGSVANGAQHSNLNEREQDQQQQEPDMVFEIPPQLHPAVSAGMKRISSAYFSIHSCDTIHNHRSGSIHSNHGSLVDILSLLDQNNNSYNSSDAASHASSTCYHATTQASIAESSGGAALDQNSPDCYQTAPEDLLYHDILMNVFGFLDLDSLAAFSETARRSNFEVFYYLQLQLQRALLQATPGSSQSTTASFATTGLSTLAGTCRLARLAQEEPKTADLVVQGYLDSNTSLQQMPLSYSLSYLRHVLMRQYPGSGGSANASSSSFPGSTTTVSQPDASLFSGAALLVAFIGAASLTMNAEGMMPNVDAFMPDAAELPNMLFRVGFVGSLMSAARRSFNQSKEKQQPSDDSSTSNGSATMTGSMQSMMNRLMRAAYGDEQEEHPQHGESSRPERTNSITNRQSELLSPNPYDHLPAVPSHPKQEVTTDASKPEDNSTALRTPSHDENTEDESFLPPRNIVTTTESADSSAPCRKTPTGCVGAYRKAIRKATSRIVELVKEDRMKNYKSLSDDEQRLMGTALLDACSSDDQLENVREIVNRGIDVEDFYVSSDGTETSALHAAAFHGSFAILEYLCAGLDDGEGVVTDATTRYFDGGLCNVNLRDSNGWTALHFAAGTNCTRSIQILFRHGADLTLEAANGYTPHQWAVRLQNHEVAKELSLLLHDRKTTKHDARVAWPSPTRFFLSLRRTARAST